MSTKKNAEPVILEENWEALFKDWLKMTTASNHQEPAQKNCTE